MRTLLLTIILLTTLLRAEESIEENYLGSNYNLALAFEPSCLHLVGNTDVINEHIASVGKIGFCDTYTDNLQTYLKESIYLGAGAAFYANSVYRDSFFMSLSLNLERAWISDVVQDITGDSYSLYGSIGTGYQWHFQKGYILSLVVYASYRKPFKYKDAGDSDMSQELSQDETNILPTFLVGWRF